MSVVSRYSLRVTERAGRVLAVILLDGKVEYAIGVETESEARAAFERFMGTRA